MSIIIRKQLRIGIVDSGKGGQFIAQKIAEVFPNGEFFQYHPYSFRAFGSMCMQDLQNQIDLQLDFLRGRNLDFVVIGCMTASVRFADYISESLPYPVYDLYSLLPELPSNTNVVCTPNSVPGFKGLSVVPCVELASLIERNYPEIQFNEKTISGFIRGYFFGLRYFEEYAPLLIGCTHYYDVVDILKKVANPSHIIYPHTNLIKKLICDYE